MQVTFSPALSDDDIKAEAVLLCHNEMKLQDPQKAKETTYQSPSPANIQKE